MHLSPSAFHASTNFLYYHRESSLFFLIPPTLKIINRLLLQMVMNESLVTALLKSTTSPCWLRWNAIFCSGHLQRNILGSFTELGIATICQVHGLFHFKKI